MATATVTVAATSKVASIIISSTFSLGISAVHVLDSPMSLGGR